MNRTWMQSSKLMVMVAVALAVGPVAWGQTTGAKETTDSSAEVTAQEAQPLPAEAELSVVALDRVAKASKYAFVFFFRAADEPTQSMRAALESGVEEMPAKAEVIAIDVTDPLEKAAVDRFRVSRAPMPLILAIAPTGAITKSWLRNFDAKQLEQAFVSPGEAGCLKALQDRKLVLVCVQNGKTSHNAEAMRGVTEFKADKLYAGQTAVLSVDPTDEAEADFLKKLRVRPETEDAITVLLAPPGRPIATLTGATNKADIIAAMKQAASACAPGSGCCPPKKPAAQTAGGQNKP
ncbi:MAG: hypothetical protein AB1601_14285 [Planctomycetota bacterium]